MRARGHHARLSCGVRPGWSQADDRPPSQRLPVRKAAANKEHARPHERTETGYGDADLASTQTETILPACRNLMAIASPKLITYHNVMRGHIGQAPGHTYPQSPHAALAQPRAPRPAILNYDVFVPNKALLPGPVARFPQTRRRFAQSWMSNRRCHPRVLFWNNATDP